VSDVQVAVHETQASWVFLAGELAYKVKKSVRLAFLDYSTLSLRHAACLEEVHVNRELAPGIYLG
jgi:aminoglycoside phosphotransferase family enzyme